MATILHVDDDPYWRDQVKRTLRHTHHRLDSAGTFDDALDLLGTSRDCPYDLVIVDRDLVAQGDVLGENLIGHIKAAEFHVLIIVLTGSPMLGSHRLYCDRLGVDDIVFKGDVEPRELLASIEHALRLRQTAPTE
jgi:DNA-binding response OmpR family regulator